MGKQMKITAPVHSYKSAQLQIEAGADEIYFGVAMRGLKNTALSARGVKAHDGTPCQVSEEELRKVVKYAHDHEVKAIYLANASMNDEGKKYMLSYLNMGINADVDAIMIGDLTVLLWIKEMNFDIPVYGGIFLTIFNKQYIKWLARLGIRRVVLAHHIRMPELKKITQYKQMEYEVFMHLGCSNINGRCYLVHGAGENINVGIPCRSLWRIKSSQGLQQGRILDSAKDCGICAIPLLHEANIRYLKLLGRCLPSHFSAMFTKIYVNAVKEFEEGKSAHEMRESLLGKYKWWEEKFCKMGRCKFLETHTAPYEI